MPSTADPVEDWLNSPPITTATDGLQWWTAMAASGHPLSEMGTNFLSIPGMYGCFGQYGSLTTFYV
jgi:hypothetical protein